MDVRRFRFLTFPHDVQEIVRAKRKYLHIFYANGRSDREFVSEIVREFKKFVSGRCVITT